MNWIIYPTTLISALILGMWIAESRCENRVLARKLYIAGVIGGFIGSHLFLYLLKGSVGSGTNSYGFALGAIISFSSYYYWLHRDWADTDFLDALAPASAFGIGLFRIGCFYAGCCFGTVCDLPWSIRYGSDSFAFSDQLAKKLVLPVDSVTLAIHPVQLYESIVSLIGFALILVIFRIKDSLKESRSSTATQLEIAENTRLARVQKVGPSWFRWLPLQRYELFLGWIAYYGMWRILSVPFRADSGHFLAIDQAVWAVSTALSIAIIIARRRFITTKTPPFPG